MDKLEYLHQISQSNRPVKPSHSLMGGGLIIKILAIGLIATAILIAVGMLINNGSTRATDLSRQLFTRINNVNSVISNYNPRLKSSQLRSISHSLSGVLSGTSAQLGGYLKATYSDSKTPTTPSAETAADEAYNLENLNTLLYNARLNGVLDRTYATQIYFQLSMLMTMTSELIARDQDPKLIAILDAFYSNLDTIEQTLSAYNDPGN